MERSDREQGEQSASEAAGGRPAEYTTVGPGARDYDRYEATLLEDGSVLVYDRDEGERWLQSDGAVELADAR